MCKVKYILLIYLFINIQIIVSQNTKRCNCYMLGTFHNKAGQSICDKYTGVCSCLKNIDGIDCDKCREGYYDILSGRGCKFCACNMLGSIAQRCHQTTGKCICKPGYLGDKCEFCENEAPIISNKCCNCNEALSETSICDRKGTCKCKAHATGDKCEKCNDSYYYEENKGCVACGKCYETIGAHLKEYRMKLAAAKKLIVESVVQNNEATIWRQFDRQIMKLESKIESISIGLLDFKNKHNNDRELSENTIGNLNNLIENVELIATESNALVKQVMLKKNQNIAKLTQRIENLNKTITENSQNFNRTRPVDISNTKLIEIESESKELYEKIEELMKELENINKIIISDEFDATKINEIIKNVKNPHQAVYDELKDNFTRISRNWEADVVEVRNLSVELKKNAEYIKSRVQTLKYPDLPNVNIDENDFSNIKSQLSDYKFDLTHHIDFIKAHNKVKKLNELMEYTVEIREKNVKYMEEFNETSLIADIIKISDKVKNERKMLEENINLMKAELDTAKAEIKDNQNRLNEDLLPKINNLKTKITELISTNSNMTESTNTLINSLEELKIEIDEIIRTNKNLQELVQLTSNDLNVFEANINSLIKREAENKKLVRVFRENFNVLKQIEKMYVENISIMKELIATLAINPLHEDNHDELIEAEREIEALEENYRSYDTLVQYRDELKHEVERIKVIVDNLPENDAFCKLTKPISKK